MRKTVLFAAAMLLCASESVLAATSSCETQAAAKKVSVAAQARFVNKCQKDATEVATNVCSSQAEDQKLAGGAKKSFVKKCVKEATASKHPVNSAPGIG